MTAEDADKKAREKAEDTIRAECNSYDQTVQALKALAHEMLWDDDLKQVRPRGVAYFGRRMDTSPNNPISPNNQVTPDLVVRTTETYGIVAEAKLKLSRSPVEREPKISQAQKYDDDLKGWDTPDGLLKNHDIVLIVDHFDGKEIDRQLQTLLKEGKLKFKRKFALIRFAIVERKETCCSLEMMSGELSDERKKEKLEKTLAIRLDHIAGNPLFAGVELYDARPPDALMMKIVHENVTILLTADENRIFRETGKVEKELRVKALRDFISASSGPGKKGERIPEIPQASWLRHALDDFVKLGWAKKISDNTYVYEVKDRRKPFEQFLALHAQEMLKKEKALARDVKEHPLLKDVIQKEAESEEN